MVISDIIYFNRPEIMLAIPIYHLVFQTTVHMNKLPETLECKFQEFHEKIRKSLTIYFQIIVDTSD